MYREAEVKRRRYVDPCWCTYNEENEMDRADSKTCPGLKPRRSQFAHHHQSQTTATETTYISESKNESPVAHSTECNHCRRPPIPTRQKTRQAHIYVLQIPLLFLIGSVLNFRVLLSNSNWLANLERNSPLHPKDKKV